MTSTRSRFDRLRQRFDQFDPEFEANFFEVANELREQCPVAHSDANGGFWTFTRYADVKDGFSDDSRYSAVPTVTIPVNPAAVPILPLQAEQDVHRDYRRILDPYFRPREVAKYEDGIRDITTGLIDEFIERGECEFIAEFAHKLPGAVVFRLFLGLPETEIAEAFRLTLAIMHALGTPQAATVHHDFMRLIERMLERRRAEPPRGDIIDALFSGTVGDRPLFEDELLRIVLMLIAAGLDTTAHALGTMMITLTRQPELRTQLEANPALLPRAIEEMLRFEPPAGGLVRTAVKDAVVGGQQVKAGERVLLLVAAANRDPAEYDQPDEVNFERDNVRHLSFGYAAHYCLGVHLARLELRVALTELLRRMKDVTLLDDHIPYDSGTSRGPVALNLRFTPGARSAG